MMWNHLVFAAYTDLQMFCIPLYHDTPNIVELSQLLNSDDTDILKKINVWHPSWWTHRAISHSSQSSTTGLTKVLVCVILSEE